MGKHHPGIFRRDVAKHRANERHNILPGRIDVVGQADSLANRNGNAELAGTAREATTHLRRQVPDLKITAVSQVIAQQESGGAFAMIITSKGESDA